MKNNDESTHESTQESTQESTHANDHALSSGPGTVVPGIEVVDLGYLGEPRSVATAFIGSTGQLAIVDPGPTSTLATVRQNLADRAASVADIEAILLTHIHLDHAGATGTLLRENPRIRVYVHARGAAHLADPSRLLRSATRIYGDQMERLWGDVLPVPSAQIHVLGERDTITVAGRAMHSMYTPGHASHHVCYLDEESGVAFAGDTAGERDPGVTYVLPVTPPPDIDTELWVDSLHRIRAWRPTHLMITHFGAFPDATRHLEEYEWRLAAWAAAARESLSIEGTDEERAARFTSEIETDLKRELPPHVAAHYGQSVRASWDGLARYWRTGAHAARADG